jgi:hypothetical protein
MEDAIDNGAEEKVFICSFFSSLFLRSSEFLFHLLGAVSMCVLFNRFIVYLAER